MINTELHNGDCLEYMKKIPTSSIDLIITDPPYNLGKFMEERDTNLVKMRDNFFGAAGWDDLDYKEWKKSMNKFFHQASRVLKDGGSIIVFMAIIKVETIIQLAQKHGLYYKTSDLAYLNSGEGDEIQDYKFEARSEYQKKMRMGCSYCPIFFWMYVIHILVVQKRKNIYGYMIKTVNNFNKEN